MFKKDKDVVEKSRTFLKSREIRKLKVDIMQQFPYFNDDILLLTIPNKSQVEIIKLATRTLIYLIDGVPLFFDVCGRNNLFPTVFLLWKFPTSIKTFVIYSPVSEYLLNGADLMLPGVTTTCGLESLQKDDKIAIRVRGNPLPLAVGTSIISWTDILSNGLRGKCTEVLQIYGDLCWQYARNTTANTGFHPSVILPLAGYTEKNLIACNTVPTEKSDTSAASLDNNESNFPALLSTAKTENTAAVGDTDQRAEHVKSDFTIVNIDDSDVNDEKDSPSTKELVVIEVEDEDSPVTAVMSPTTMDSIMLTALLRCLKYIIRDNQLPLLVSTLWSTLVKCSTPPSAINIKQSSHHRVNSFLKHAQDLQLLELVDNNGVLSVLSILRRHDLLQEITVADPREFRALVTGEAVTSGGSKQNSKLKVVELYKITKPARTLLGESVSGVYGKDYLTKAEATDVVTRLVRLHTSRAAPSPLVTTTAPNKKDCVCLPNDDQLMVFSLGKDWWTSATAAGNSAVSAVLPEPPATPVNGRETCSPDFPTLACSLSSNGPSARPSPPSVTPVMAWLQSSSSVARQADSSYSNVEAVRCSWYRRQDLHSAFIGKLTAYHAIVRDGGDTSIASGAPPSVQIEVKGGAGMTSRVLTAVSGLEALGIDLTDLAKDCQKKFACAAAVSPVAYQKAGINELIIQGHLGSELEEYLTNELGIPKSLISIKLAKGLKMKKKKPT